MEAMAWAREQFWSAALCDLRLQRRLVEVAACIRENPRGTLPRALGEPMALKGAYRLLGNPKVTHERVLEPHIIATRDKCRVAGDYLIIEDTTALSFTQRGAAKGMGPLTQPSSQGFLVHTSLAARIAHWSGQNEPEVTLAGVFGQQCWARQTPEGTRAQRKRVQRVKKRAGDASSESDRWGRSMWQAGSPPSGVQWTLVADRECDIFPVLSACAQHGYDWVIRAAQARRTTSAEGKVFETVSQAPILGRFSLALRARPGVAAREAHVEVRAAETEIIAPRDSVGCPKPQPVTLVEVRESNAPLDAEPLHWVLLTSWSCASFAQVRRVVGVYACRWLVEEYHKALKSGTHIEESQLSHGERIQALLAIHAVVAADLLQLKLLAHTHPDHPIADELLTPQALMVLEHHRGRPEHGWTNASTMRAIARMGGYLGRKHDGPPGWLSIWRGWQRLTLMVEGYLLAIQQQTCG